MPGKNNSPKLRQLIQSHFDETKKLKEKKLQNDKIFHAHTENIQNEIRSIKRQFNDI